MKTAVWSLIASLVLMVSCSEPVSYESFIKPSETDSLGRFCYEFKMDTAAVYDISIYTRIDACGEGVQWQGDIRMDASWVSPSGNQFFETVYIPRKEFVSILGIESDCVVRYRSGIRPDAAGLWKLVLELPELTGADGFRGMGIKITLWERTN
jgi:hypothetical protein